MFALRQWRGWCPITALLSLFHTPMLKREGRPAHRGNPKVKKYKGVKIRALMVPESNEEDHTSNVKTDYAHLVQTRVTASGKVGGITTSSIPLQEVEDVTNDVLLEVHTDCAGHNIGDTVIEDVVPVVPVTRKKRKKANDSVSLIQPYLFSCSANSFIDQDAFLARRAFHRNRQCYHP